MVVNSGKVLVYSSLTRRGKSGQFPGPGPALQLVRIFRHAQVSLGGQARATRWWGRVEVEAEVENRTLDKFLSRMSRDLSTRWYGIAHPETGYGGGIDVALLYDRELF